MARQFELFVNAEPGGFHLARVSEGADVLSDVSSNSLLDILTAAVKLGREKHLANVAVIDPGKKLLTTTTETTMTLSQLDQYATALNRRESR